MIITKKYIERIALFDILFNNIDVLYTAFNEIYFVELTEALSIKEMITNEKYRRIVNVKQIILLKECISLYGLDLFSKDDELILIDIKEKMFEILQKNLSEPWCLKNIWEHADSAFCKSIIGTLYYYGINRTVDQERGEKLLIEAAHMGDSDALLWCLWKHPEKAREYMEQLVSLPESLANPEWLNPWKEHYNLWDVKEKQIVKHKIGF